MLEKQYPRLIILILFIAFLLGNERESFSDISYLLLLELKWFQKGTKKKRKSEARAGKRTLKFQLPCKPQTSLCLSSLIATSLVGFSENTLHDYKINFQGVILAEQMLQLSSFLNSFHSLNQSSRGKNIERKS